MPYVIFRTFRSVAKAVMALRDIAEKAGVSVSTVSRVVNNKHHGKISVETRARILEIARSTGYQPNRHAVSLATGRSHSALGLVIPYHSHTFRNFFFSELCVGALDAAYERGMDMNLMVARDASAACYHSLLAHRGVAGAILVGNEVGVTALEGCRLAGVPGVIISHPGEADGMAVQCDDAAGTADAVRHLLGLGHTRIAFLAGPKHMPDAQSRLQGYCRALQEAGVPCDDALVCNGDFSYEAAYQATARLLGGGHAVTAIACANDEAAFGAMAAVKDARLRIPGDVSVVGFDDGPLAAHVDPPLTTVHQPVYEMGRRAAEMLMDYIAGERARTRHSLPGHLVVRGSTGPPAARPACAARKTFE